MCRFYGLTTVLLVGAMVRPAAAKTLNLYVAPVGNDRWTGRLAAPNRSRTDGPLATLERARDVLRSARRIAPQDATVVYLREGTYRLDHTLAFDDHDSGTASAPVVFRAYGSESVRIVGGREARDWRPVTDPAISSRLDPEARVHVMQSDLRAQGITEYGSLTPRGFGRAETPAALELFFQDRPMTLARWPNGESWAAIKSGLPGGDGFTYDGDRPARWARDEDVWVHGYWTFDWADTYQKVASINTARHEIVTEAPQGAFGYSPGRRFYALNILEELDSPGEWYLDRRAGVLYFWPPADLKTGRTMVSLLESPLITIRKASHITLQRLTLEDTRGSAIEITDSRDCMVAGCVVRNVGTNAIVISGGTRCGVQSCNVSETGDGGVLMTGGDRTTLAPGNHFVDNCQIDHPGRWDRTYRPAIGIYGVGNRASHNVIHDGPHNAILMGGNDHVVEYNDISRVCTQTGDAGAVYMGRDLAQRGTVIRYNHFHDIGPTIHATETGRYTDVMGVYLDDCFCGVTILGNLFERAGTAIMVGGGRDNTIENNVFVDYSPAIHVDERGKSWASKYFKPGSEWMILEHLKEVPYNRPPYSTRYPHLSNILEDDPAAAKYNRILRNIRTGPGRWIDWQDGMGEKTVETVGNFATGNPGFVDAARGDYRLRPGAPPLKLGFRPLPFARIGLYRDRFRNTFR